MVFPPKCDPAPRLSSHFLDLRVHSIAGQQIACGLAPSNASDTRRVVAGNSTLRNQYGPSSQLRHEQRLRLDHSPETGSDPDGHVRG